jgi:hypothetical protein
LAVLLGTTAGCDDLRFGTSLDGDDSASASEVAGDGTGGAPVAVTTSVADEGEEADGAPEDEAAQDSGAPESGEGAEAGEGDGADEAQPEPEAATGGGAALEAAGDTAVAAAPGSADPLSAEETERALQLALAGPATEELMATAIDRDAVLYGTTATELDAASESERVSALADRPSYRVLYSQRYPGKDAQGRVAEVMVHRYDTGETVLSKIDLGSGEVERLNMPEGAPVPMVPEEIAEAAVIARQDPAVRVALEEAGFDPDTVSANGLLTGTNDESSPCATNRCLRLFFSTVKRPVPEFSVVVDIVNLQVVEIAAMPGRSLNE